MLVLRPTTPDDLRELTGWEQEPNTSTWLLARAYGHHGGQNVWLDVKSHDVRARSLYESVGFVVRETRTKAIVDADGTISDLVIMVHQHR